MYWRCATISVSTRFSAPSTSTRPWPRPTSTPPVNGSARMRRRRCCAGSSVTMPGGGERKARRLRGRRYAGTLRSHPGGYVPPFTDRTVTPMQQLTLQTPDDWHVHLRDGDMLGETVPATARCFRRAIVMPNLVPPVRTAQEAQAYRARILAARPQGSLFEPLMTLYLTDHTTPAQIREAAALGVPAVKLYPAGATTNSDVAVTGFAGLDPVLEALSETGMLLLVHGEVTDAEVDIFDREKAFIDQR